MTHHFKLSFWKIIKGLTVPIFFLLFFLTINHIEYYQDNYDNEFLWVSLLFTLIISLPSLVLLINHLAKTYNIELSIDCDEQMLTIKKDRQIFNYKKDQLNKVTLIETTSYPLIIDITIFWSVFGYLKLEFNDNKVFYLSSLAVNPKKLDSLKIDESDLFFPLITK